jgi:hypothetical protein
MPSGLHFLRLPLVQIAALALVCAAAAAAALLSRKRINPEEVERQRRILVNQHGRIADGVITDIEEDTIHFAYCINGVDYQAVQSVASLRDFLPPEPHRSIGPVTLKYLSRNPANSIVICEKWTGLRERAEP